tara:strand:+ start:5047 stop:7074 length:2028 start_codon:yes stop_codon:yes gene_type:complete
MACTTVSAPIDIEQIHGQDDDFAKITPENRYKYENLVFAILKWIMDIEEKNKNSKNNINMKKEFHRYFARISREVTKRDKIFIKKTLVIYIYRRLIEEGKLESHPLMWQLIQKRSRNISGITSITVLTSPFPDGQKFSCKHNCYMCPAEPGQPRSYLTKEPAVSRATRNKHDAILQITDRLNSLLACGCEIDKIEIIIEGGTYTEYPVEYLERFHRDLIYVANTYFDREKRDKLTINEEIMENRSAKIKIIGICIETRPDALGESNNGKHWLRNFREWGVTRVQVGVQSLDDNVLLKINRGHTVNDAIKGIYLLKTHGFKVDIHMMPDLPGATPETDKMGFHKLFTSTLFRPDQVKVYPNEVVPWSVLKKMYDRGEYVPYAEKNQRDIMDVVKYAIENCPPDIRFPRVTRDIPTEYISAGNEHPNLRQMAEKELVDEGKHINEIRFREIGRHPEYSLENAKYRIREYPYTGGNKDFFISLESPDEKVIFGFLRLMLPNIVPSEWIKNPNNSWFRDFYQVFPCLYKKGLVRELHVYGNVVPVGYNKKKEIQHKGVGRTLLKMAEWITYTDSNCYDGIAVISGIGVMDYYSKNGYHYDDTYMIKKFRTNFTHVVPTGILAIVVSNVILPANNICSIESMKYINLFMGFIIIISMCTFYYLRNYSIIAGSFNFVTSSN